MLPGKLTRFTSAASRGLSPPQNCRQTKGNLIPVGDQFTGSGRNIQIITAGLNYEFGGWR